MAQSRDFGKFVSELPKTPFSGHLLTNKMICRYRSESSGRTLQTGPQPSGLDVTLHSNAGKCALGYKYCTQFPEFAELFVLKSRTETDASKKG
jgi:hypothetical protein